MILHDNFLKPENAWLDHIWYYFRVKLAAPAVLDSIVVSIPACHAGDRGSIPRRGGEDFLFWRMSSSVTGPV